jgi:AcrR family transcriptional regulator
MNNREKKQTLVRRTREMLDGGLEHPTRKAIIDAVAQIMKEKGVNALHLDDVMAATGLTRGAVYHHFKNVDELVEGALLATYAEGVDVNIGFIRELLANAQSFAEFRDGVLRANVLYSENNRLREVRKLRAHAMAVADTDGAMAAKLATEQQRLTDEYVAVIVDAQSRGWVRRDVDPMSLAVFIQAYSFGVIVDDVSREHLEIAAWRRMIESFFENCVFNDAPSS